MVEVNSKTLKKVCHSELVSESIIKTPFVDAETASAETAPCRQASSACHLEYEDGI